MPSISVEPSNTLRYKAIGPKGFTIIDVRGHVTNARIASTHAYRAGLGVAIVATLLLVWVNFIQGADGVNPAAFRYLWVPLVGLAGVAIARFHPRGMAHALFATALAQVLALAIVLMTWNPSGAHWTVPVARGFGLNIVFGLLFAVSAFLFRKAST